MAVIPIRTYRARWIIELSTFSPFNSPPRFFPPLGVELVPVEFVTVGLGASVLPVGSVVTSVAADTNIQQLVTKTAARTL